MILSEFAGAAQSLNGSIIVNPWNTEELAQAIEDAITMSDEQRAMNHLKLYKYVTRYTSQYWGTRSSNPITVSLGVLTGGRQDVCDGIEADRRGC